MNEKLITEYEPTHGYLIIRSPEGFKATLFKDGDDIRNFDCFSIAYTSKDADVSLIRLITDEEADRLQEKRNEAVREEMEKEMNNMNSSSRDYSETEDDSETE